MDVSKIRNSIGGYLKSLRGPALASAGYSGGHVWMFLEKNPDASALQVLGDLTSFEGGGFIYGAFGGTVGIYFLNGYIERETENRRAAKEKAERQTGIFLDIEESRQRDAVGIYRNLYGRSPTRDSTLRETVEAIKIAIKYEDRAGLVDVFYDLDRGYTGYKDCWRFEIFENISDLSGEKFGDQPLIANPMARSSRHVGMHHS